jgi:hypothetical protein
VCRCSSRHGGIGAGEACWVATCFRCNLHPGVAYRKTCCSSWMYQTVTTGVWEPSSVDGWAQRTERGLDDGDSACCVAHWVGPTSMIPGIQLLHQKVETNKYKNSGAVGE